MACSLNCFCCCRGMQSTGITIGVFRLIFSLCMIGLAIKWIILGIDIMNDSHTTNQSKSEEIGEYFGISWFKRILTYWITVRISVLGVIIVTYLIDFIVSIVLIIGICLRLSVFIYRKLFNNLLTVLFVYPTGDTIFYLFGW